MQLRIGDIAKQTGISGPTIRYYESSGLLRPSSREDNGYRVFDEHTITRIRFILRAKDSGFSLSEIRELISLMDEDTSHFQCEKVNSLIDKKRRQIASRIRALRSMDRALQHLHKLCADHTPENPCPSLTVLSEGTHENK